MGPRVVILNGAPAAGKSTVGRLLAARARNGVCIDGDALAGFIVRRDLDRVAHGLGYRHGGMLAAGYIDAGYELAVFTYIFQGAAAVERFLAACDAPAPVHLFTLRAPLATLEARERGRSGRRPLGARVAEAHAAIEANLDELGVAVDAAQRPGHVVRRIEQLCRAGQGLVRRAHVRPQAAKRQRIAVYALARDDAGRLLLVRAGPASGSPGVWYLPGGGVEQGEHPATALVRELREETGLGCRVGALAAVLSDTTEAGGGEELHSVRLVYEAQVGPGLARAEADGTSDAVRWTAPEEAAGLELAPFLRRLLEELAGARPLEQP